MTSPGSRGSRPFLHGRVVPSSHVPNRVRPVTGCFGSDGRTGGVRGSGPAEGWSSAVLTHARPPEREEVGHRVDGVTGATATDHLHGVHGGVVRFRQGTLVVVSRRTSDVTDPTRALAPRKSRGRQEGEGEEGEREGEEGGRRREGGGVRGEDGKRE